MLTRRTLLQGVLSLAALGPLARVAVAEEVERVERLRPYSIPALINERATSGDYWLECGPAPYVRVDIHGGDGRVLETMQVNPLDQDDLGRIRLHMENAWGMPVTLQVRVEPA